MAVYEWVYSGDDLDSNLGDGKSYGNLRVHVRRHHGCWQGTKLSKSGLLDALKTPLLGPLFPYLYSINFGNVYFLVKLHSALPRFINSFYKTMLLQFIL